MQKLLFLIMILSSVLIFFSCETQYTIANTGSLMYMVKPFSRDSINKSTYIGGKFRMANENAEFFDDDDSYIGELYAFHSKTHKYTNYGIGGFGYYGMYKITSIEGYYGNKSTYGGGLQAEFNFNIPINRKIDFRIIGIRSYLTFQYGEYSKMIFDARKLNLINDRSEPNFIIGIGPTTEFVYKFKKCYIGYQN